MNNNMQPNFFPNPNMNFPNINEQLRNIENRIYNLEKEIIMIKNKISRIENLPTPYQENYDSNYNPNSYNMM